MAVLLVNNKNSLLRQLEELPSRAAGRKSYLVCGDVDARCISVLQEQGFQEMKDGPYDQAEKDRFLDEYVTLIGSMGRQLHSKLWWATDIASKNRFMSRLPFLLHQFLRIMESAKEQHHEDVMLVLNPSWVIVETLKQALAKEGIACTTCRQAPFEKTADVLGTVSRRILAYFYFSMLVLARKLHVAMKLGTGIRGFASEGESRFVIKTFIYDSSFPGEGRYRDAFFGSLPNFLKKRKKLFIVANIVGNYGRCIEQIRTCKDVQILPIEAFVTLRDVVSSLREVLTARLRVQGPLNVRGYDVSDILNTELLRTHNGISFYQFLHFGAARVLAERMRIESFLFTYENNPWERMCMLAVKGQSPQTILIGYQHTVVPHASANMFVSSLEKGLLPMPDRIITVGEAPRDIMEKYGDYPDARIEPGCGLRFEYLFQLPLSPRRNRGNILVALEGIFDVYHLVNYCLENLKEAGEYSIRVRTHPVLPLDQMAGKLVRPLESVPHFSLSTSKALKDDLEWADVVIYWGSTVALEALCLGKPVIHYDMGSILNYDPLFQCSELKWVVTHQDDLHKTVRDIFAMSDEEYAEKQRMAKDYINRYFLPVTEERMKRFLTESTAQSTRQQASNR